MQRPRWGLFFLSLVIFLILGLKFATQQNTMNARMGWNVQVKVQTSKAGQFSRLLHSTF